MAVTLHFTSVPLRSRTMSWACAAAARQSASAAARVVVLASLMDRSPGLLDALHGLVDDRQAVGAVEALLRLLELRPVPGRVRHHLLGGLHGLLVDRQDLLVDARVEQGVLGDLPELPPFADRLGELLLREVALLDAPLRDVVVLLPVALALRGDPAAQVLLEVLERLLRAGGAVLALEGQALLPEAVGLRHGGLVGHRRVDLLLEFRDLDLAVAVQVDLVAGHRLEALEGLEARALARARILQGVLGDVE